MNKRDPLQLATGAAIGALAMYLMDPQRGRARRAEIGDTVSDLAQRAMPDDGMRMHEEHTYQPYRRHDVDVEHYETSHRGSRGPGLLPLISGLGLAAYAWQRYSSQQGTDGRIDVSHSIHIDAPPETVFDLWSNYENFPYFMRNAEEVRPLDGNRSHWVVKGPMGSRVEFNSMLVSSDRPRLLAWRSEPGSQVDNEGSVRLEPSGTGTRATVQMSYQPPGGGLGHAVASMFGRNPQQELVEDLQRMKTFIETGRPPSGSAQSAGQMPAMTGEQAGMGFRE